MARTIISSGLAMVTGYIAPVHAGVWNFAGRSELSAGYDDNVRLSPTQSIAAWNGVADLSGQLLFQDDALLLRLSPRLLAARYDGEQALNRTEQYLTLSAQKNSERGSSSLSLSGTQDTTLTSELGLTGLAEVNKKHRSVSATLSNAFSPSERINTSAQLYASANYYLDAANTGLVDYNYGSAVLSTSYAWSERSMFSLQATAGKLQVPDISAYDKVNLAVTLGYGVQLAPRWRADISLGPSRVSTGGQAQTGSVYDVSLSRKSELMNLTLSATRDVTPTGRGLLTRREQVRLGLSQEITPRWSTDWSLTGIRNRNLLPGGGLERDVVTYGDATASFSWRLRPTWSLSLSAGYTQQRGSEGEPLAERRHGALNISWNGLTQRLH